MEIKTDIIRVDNVPICNNLSVLNVFCSSKIIPQAQCTIKTIYVRVFKLGSLIARNSRPVPVLGMGIHL